jgi:DNA-binding transcriptional ArsR family regulator
VLGEEAAENPLDWSWTAVLSDPVRLSVLHALCDLQTATTLELCRRCHSSDSTVRRHLDALEAIGLVREHPGERDGLTLGRPARRYTLDAVAGDKVRTLFELLSEPLVPTAAPAMQPPRDPETGPGSCTPPPAGSRASAPSSLR